ncbi:hypothetical protein OS176_08450 [Xanthomonadaceae bacterium XH05]|nr:hypothetical protein [Xanthomonadaceae bacterium XH05]
MTLHAAIKHTLPAVLAIVTVCLTHADLLGNPRPTDGDGDGNARCDIGAFGLPDAAADPIFADGFED